MMEQKTFKLNDFALDGQGEFVGYASIYGVRDLTGDVVDSGAFSRTIQHKNGKVTFLCDHDPRMRAGVAYLWDTEVGLKIKGVLNLATDIGQRVHEEMKFSMAHEQPTGLSIGYDTVKEIWENGVRHLKEIRLYEISHVTFPALPSAHITGVKNAGIDQEEQIMDEYQDKKARSFAEALEIIAQRSELNERRWRNQWALDEVINEIMNDVNLSDEGKLSLLTVSLDQYKNAMLQWGRDVLALGAENLLKMEEKAGRVLSGRNVELVRNALTALQALLSAAETDPETSDDEQKGLARETKDTEIDSLAVELSRIRDEMTSYKTR